MTDVCSLVKYSLNSKAQSTIQSNFVEKYVITKSRSLNQAFVAIREFITGLYQEEMLNIINVITSTPCIFGIRYTQTCLFRHVYQEIILRLSTHESRDTRSAFI